jgi:Leucine-rich repeat (LRR) protein
MKARQLCAKVGMTPSEVVEAKVLHIPGMGIGVAYLTTLANVSRGLCSLGALRTLNLYNNQIADQGMIALANAIGNGSMGNLVELFLPTNAIGDPGMIAFADALKSPIGSMPNLACLGLFENQIGDASLIAFADTIRCSGSMANLTTLDLANNSISDAGMISLSEAIGSLPLLVKLSVDYGPPGSSQSSHQLLEAACEARGIDLVMECPWWN